MTDYPSVKAAVREARQKMGNPPGVYPILPAAPVPSPADARPPTRAEVLTELRRLLASGKTVLPGQIKAKHLSLATAWHRLECLDQAIRLIEEN